MTGAILVARPSTRGRSSMAEPQSSKLTTRVRFPSPARRSARRRARRTDAARCTRMGPCPRRTSRSSSGSPASRPWARTSPCSCLSTTPTGSTTSTRARPAAATAACTELRTAVDALPRCRRARRATRRQRGSPSRRGWSTRLVQQVPSVGPQALDADVPAEEWLADWQVLVQARAGLPHAGAPAPVRCRCATAGRRRADGRSASPPAGSPRAHAPRRERGRGPAAFFEALDVVGAPRELVAVGGTLDPATLRRGLPRRLLPVAAVRPARGRARPARPAASPARGAVAGAARARRRACRGARPQPARGPAARRAAGGALPAPAAAHAAAGTTTVDEAFDAGASPAAPDREETWITERMRRRTPRCTARAARTAWRCGTATGSSGGCTAC